MAIKKYLADADNTIVNAFKSNLRTRGTGSNAGYADVMEVFSIYGRESSGSQELSRVLVKFPVSDISADRTAGTIPASGSVSFLSSLIQRRAFKNSSGRLYSGCFCNISILARRRWIRSRTVPR